MRSKTVAVMLALVVVLSLAGCSKAQSGAVILYDTETLCIEREGAETRVHDKAGNDDYTFTRRIVKKKPGTVSEAIEATTTADTDTIKLETIRGYIIVTDKTEDKTLYFRG